MNSLQEIGITNLQKIGQGSFGQVFKAHYQDQHVAVKVLNNQIIQNSQIEITILEKMDHPNIIRLFKEFKIGSTSYLIMEYCGGGTLRDLLIHQFTEDEIIQIMRSLFSALEYLHSNGIIHRDIKPDNILIKNKNDFTSIKVADFGLSFQYNTEIQYYQTVSHQCGTFIFMAPEQIQNLPYNKTVDTWSCGIVLYMLLSGQHPYYPRLSTKTQFINSYPNIQYQEPSNASPLARDLLKRLLCYDPHRRYTALQALSHPWITRRHNDSIPMGLKEFGTCKQNLETMIYRFKALIILQYLIKQEPQLRSISRQASQTCSETSIQKSTLPKLHKLKPIKKDNRIRLQYLAQLLTQQKTQTQNNQNNNQIELIQITSQPQLDSPQKKINRKHQLSVDCGTDIQLIGSISPFKGESEHNKIESPKKSFRQSQSFQRLILPQLSESTQTSISPDKKESKTLVIRKSQSTLQICLQKIQKANEPLEQKTTLRQRMETYDQKHHSHRNLQKANSLNTSTISPKNKLIQQIIQHQQQLLFPSYRKKL